MFLKYADKASGLSTASSIILIVLALICVVWIAERFVFGQPVPRGIPLLREPEGARYFSWRTRLTYYTNCKELFREAYHEVSEQIPASSLTWQTSLCTNTPHSIPRRGSLLSSQAWVTVSK